MSGQLERPIARVVTADQRNTLVRNRRSHPDFGARRRSAITACRSICAARPAWSKRSSSRPAVDNEQEGYGRNAGSKLHYYRIAMPMTEIWPDYAGSPRDGLRIEVFETWLERI